jgi:endonuclease G
MKRLLLLLLLLSTTLSAQTLRDSVFIKTSTFSVYYSERLEQPLSVSYNVLCSGGEEKRSGIKFLSYKGVKTSNDLDYSNNIWDKGHLAPAADFNCDKDMLKSTFSYLNCALQNQYLNRGTWKSLETYERKLSEKCVVHVEVKLKFSKNSKKLKTGATVPDGFYKKITYNGMTELYYFPNKKPISNSIKYYKI